MDASPALPAATARQQLEALGDAASLDAVLDLYDGLPPVEVAAMLGAWRGRGIATGNPFDGLLELAGWHGKRSRRARKAELGAERRGGWGAHGRAVRASSGRRDMRGSGEIG